MEAMLDALKVLSDKSKFKILSFLKDKRSYGAEIAKQLNLSTPTISYPMQALLNAGFVGFEKENNRLYYHVDKEYLAIFFHQVIDHLT